MIIPDEIVNKRDYKACADFHGHVCMGLTLGYMAAHLALRHLKEKRALDEELICITETDACCCDAIQVLTGCTLGKGNLLYRDIGKMAFTFGSRTTGVGVRIAMRPGVMDEPAEEKELAEKIRAGTAGRDEIKAYERLAESRSKKLFDGGPEAFFVVEDRDIALPSMARMAPSQLCDECREPVMMTKLAESGDKKLCRDCLQDEPNG